MDTKNQADIHDPYDYSLSTKGKLFIVACALAGAAIGGGDAYLRMKKLGLLTHRP